MLNPGSMGQLELSLVRTFVGLMSRDICIGGGASARIALPKCQDKLLDLYIERAAEMEERTPYYGVVWPSAVGLARAVGAHVRDGDRVLELGCGLGLGGIASALTANPSQVLLTDYDPAAVRLARMSAKLSRVSHVVRSAPIDWNYRPSWASLANTPLLTQSYTATSRPCAGHRDPILGALRPLPLLTHSGWLPPSRAALHDPPCL